MSEPYPSHLDALGRARMVDVSEKPVTKRRAVARARVRLSEATLARVRSGDIPKGNILETARLAGILAAKRTGELIPLCHPLVLDHVDLACEPSVRGIEIICTVTATGRTGVEMEAMTGASVAALTIYDMVKSLERGAAVEDVLLLEKSGGKSGEWRREEGS